jgi:hypothetical protein
MKGLPRQVVVLASAVLMIVALFFVSTSNPDFSGSGPDGTSNTMYDMYPTAVSPTPITFTIWLPIFLGSLALGVFQALPKNRQDSRLDALGAPLTSAFLCNALTGFAPIGYSVPVILALLASLVWAFVVLVQFQPADKTFNLLVRAPILIFFAWITVATIVNVSQWLVSLNWNGFGIPAAWWGAALILVATSIGVMLMRRFEGINLYAIVLMWAFVGIVVMNPAAVPVIVASVLGALALILAIWNGPSTGSLIRTSNTLRT